MFSLPLAVTQGWIEVSEGIMFSGAVGISDSRQLNRGSGLYTGQNL